MYAIQPVNQSQLGGIQKTINNKTKPVGALGEIEVLAKQLMLIQQQRLGSQESMVASQLLTLNKPMMLVFAADHGINEEQVSIAPSAVTQQMVINFLHGGAAINCFCRSNNIAMSVIDCGMLEAVKLPLEGRDKVEFIDQRLGAGTHNIAKHAAMTLQQVEKGLEFGHELIQQQLAQNIDIILLGEMGIGNTSSASALMSALTSFSVEQCVGVGTGITDKQFEHKKLLISQAIARINYSTVAAEINSDKTEKGRSDNESIKKVLSELGGFEIVQMVGAILSAAQASIPVVIDGFIVSVAALVASKLNANVTDYLIFSHVSQEKAHQLLLNELIKDNHYNTKPLLNLGLRLGEGSGAALAYPLLKAAQSFYNEMASFEDAGVTV
jgi:nicotinate-nucleotide--dimethylbenzimidazole phosphoribosyltransferase